MICPNCSQENKDAAQSCKKCARDLTLPPAWFPDWKWHMRTLGTIYAVVTVGYFAVTFVLRQLPEPYHLRRIPAELTPWLGK